MTSVERDVRRGAGTADGHPAAQSAARHLEDLIQCLGKLTDQAGHAAAWGRELTVMFAAGGKLLVAGNGGSAAEAQHVSAEFIGRYSTERMAYPAICLAAESSSITAIMNDYGTDSVFARQVEAHGLAGDVLLCLSTSGRSPNIVAAAAAARDLGVTTWAMTGRGPNKLSAVVDDWIEVDSDVVATVQEAHLALLHILCEAFDEAVPAAGAGRRRRPLR